MDTKSFFFLASKLLLALSLLFLLASELLLALSLLLSAKLLSLLSFSFLLFFALLFNLIAHVLERDLLNQILVLAHLSQFFAAAKTATKRECRLGVVLVCRWVVHSERAVDSTAVLGFTTQVPALIVASFAEVSCSEAMEECYRAAEVAFPVYLCFAVLFAISLSCTVCLELAVFASQVLFLGALFKAKLLLAVDHATEVRLLAVVALVKCAGM